MTQDSESRETTTPHRPRSQNDPRQHINSGYEPSLWHRIAGYILFIVPALPVIFILALFGIPGFISGLVGLAVGFLFWGAVIKRNPDNATLRQFFPDVYRESND